MKKTIILITGFIFVLLGFSYYSIFIKEKNLDKVFIVDKGLTIKEITKNLKDKNIIDNKILFDFYYSLFKDTNTIKSGKYTFLGNYNIPKIFEVLVGNPMPITNTRKLTIIEGWNKYDIAKYLEKTVGINYSDTIKFIEKDYKTSSLFTKYNFLNNSDIHDLEGFIFPDTYEVFLDKVNIEYIFDKTLGNFNTKIILKYNLDKSKLYSTIVLASIIEKEARFDKDRKMVASVLENRLNANMKLDMDSTVLYFTQNRDKIYEDKWDTTNPYNTYRKRGLPIGAISNPSLNSIDSVINPEKSDYFYYLNKNNGEAVFARTLDEHNANIYKYLK